MLKLLFSRLLVAIVADLPYRDWPAPPHPYEFSTFDFLAPPTSALIPRPVCPSRRFSTCHLRQVLPDSLSLRVSVDVLSLTSALIPPSPSPSPPPSPSPAPRVSTSSHLHRSAAIRNEDSASSSRKRKRVPGDPTDARPGTKSRKGKKLREVPPNQGTTEPCGWIRPAVRGGEPAGDPCDFVLGLDRKREMPRHRQTHFDEEYMMIMGDKIREEDATDLEGCGRASKDWVPPISRMCNRCGRLLARKDRVKPHQAACRGKKARST